MSLTMITRPATGDGLRDHATGARGGTPTAVTASGQQRPASARSWLRVACVGGALAALYALGALLPFWFVTSPRQGTAFFLPVGLTLALLCLSPRRTWPLWLSLVACTEFVVDITHHEGAALAFGFALAHSVGPLIGAWLLLRAVPSRQRSTDAFTRYVVYSVGVGPAVGAVIGASFAVLHRGPDDWGAIAWRWWLGDALGVLVVATALINWRRAPRQCEPRASLVKTMAIATAAAGVTMVPAALWHRPFLFATLPVLMWAAFAGGCRAVSFGGLAVALGAYWATLSGRANQLFASAAPGTELMLVQLFLGVTLISSLTLAVQVGSRRQGEEDARRADLERAGTEETAIRVAQAERHRLTQDTHDIVGHGLNVMLVQSGAARRVLESNVGLARELLDSVEAIGRRACRELDIAMAIWSASPEVRPGRGLDCLDELVLAMRMAGQDVHLSLQGDRSEVPTLVDWSAYRIVQEAITNVTKHAPGAATTVTVWPQGGDLHVCVVNDACGATSASFREGRGILGIRERVAALGGELHAGPSGDGRFCLSARLPCD